MRTPLPLVLLGVLGLMGWIACGPSAADVEESRAQYAAAADGFVVRQRPVPGARIEQEVVLGLVVRRESSKGEPPDGLPGITLDVDQVGAGGKSRRHWRFQVDTAGLAAGGERRSERVLGQVDYAPGDVFRVEVRRNVPATERADYLEWREPGGAATDGGPAS